MNHLSDILLHQKVDICLWGCGPISPSVYQSSGYEIIDHMRMNLQDLLAYMFLISHRVWPLFELYIKTFTPVILSAFLLSFMILNSDQHRQQQMYARKMFEATPRRPVTRSMTKKQANA